jgi:hypothetical protein
LIQVLFAGETDMSDTAQREDGTTDADKSQTLISYCPFLGLYHYKRADGDEFFFDRDKLESAVNAYLAQGDFQNAEFMSVLTAYSRQYPHMVITLFPDGTYTLGRLEIPPDERDTKVIEDVGLVLKP